MVYTEYYCFYDFHCFLYWYVNLGLTHVRVFKVRSETQRERERERGDNGLFITLVPKV